MSSIGPFSRSARTGRLSRPRWRLVYVVLSVFNVLAVVLGLVLQRFEYMTAGFMLVIVALAAFSGLACAREMEADRREKERCITELRSAWQSMSQVNETLEARVRERTDELNRTNAELQSQKVERQRTEAALRESEKHARIIIDAALDAILVIDHLGTVREWNPEAERIFGYRKSDALGRKMDELIIPPSLREAGHDSLPEYLTVEVDGPLVRPMEVCMMRAGGKEFRAELAISRNSWDEPTLYTCFIRDISERRRAEEARNQLAAIVEHSDDAIISRKLDGTVVSWNAGAEKIFGYSAEEIVGRPISLLVPSELVHEEPQIREQLKRGEQVEHYETVRLRKDARKIDVSLSMSPVRDSSGRIIGASEIARDITGRKKAEEALLQSEQRMSAIFNASRDGIMVEADERIVHANEAYARLVGHTSAAELMGQPISSLMSAEDCERMLELGRKRLRGELVPSLYQFKGRRPDGARIDLEASVSVASIGGKPHFITLVREITERLSLEAQLRQSQKMEAIGQLASGVAHDFNNLLTVIRGQSELALAYENLSAEGTEWLRQVVNAAERASNLTRQLLTFGRKQPMQPVTLDLNTAVGNLTRMLRRVIGEEIQLNINCAVSLAPIYADQGMIEQVLLNLVVNARDAMPHGGVLIVTTESVTIDSAHRLRHPEARLGSHVRLEVEDTGGGIDRGTLPRIFEPFFTTKEPGKGTGLGLATVYGIVEQHHGWIEVDSEVGRGSAFRIYFPARPDLKTAGETRALDSSVRGGTERILVAEDERELRKLIKVMLERLGYGIVEAPSGAAALKIWDDHRGEFDLLLSDIMMPYGVSGWELAAKLRAQKPQLKVLLISGYDPKIAGQEFDSAGGLSFLPKPFTPQTLARTVRQCLDGGSSSS